MKFLENLPAMDHLRSEKMSFVQLIMPVESAHRAVSYLGDLGLLQFKDVRTLISSFLIRSIRFDHFKTHLSTSQFPFPPPLFFFSWCLWPGFVVSLSRLGFDRSSSWIWISFFLSEIDVWRISREVEFRRVGILEDLHWELLLRLEFWKCLLFSLSLL